MKLIQSFWSKPFFDEEHQDDFRYRHFGGFPNAFLFYACWTYSCLSIKEYYPNLHLVTDDRGLEIFRDTLQLPYESFSTDLNELNNYPKSLWALGKLYTYRIQETPFCHIDGDVFFFGQVLDSIVDKDFFCQSFDFDEALYVSVQNQVKTHFDVIPKAFETDSFEDIRLINAGVIGGHDLPFFKEYANTAFQLIDQNIDKIHLINTGSFNLYFEQFLMSNMIHQSHREMGLLFPDPITTDLLISRFHSLPNESQYVHLANTLKRETIFLEQVVSRFQAEYPEYFDHFSNIKGLF
jgi:hypothetical protein